MKESYGEGVANHIGLGSYAGVCKGVGGTLIEERTGRVLSREMSNQGADAVAECGRRNDPQREGKRREGPARSETPRHVRKHDERGLGDPAVVCKAADRIGKSKDVHR